MALLEQVVELLIQEVHPRDQLKSKAIQLYWRESEETIPNGELLLEPPELLDGHWPDQMETTSDVTDMELALVPVMKCHRKIYLTTIKAALNTMCLLMTFKSTQTPVRQHSEDP